MKLGVLISGGGTNLQSILDAVSGGRLAAEVAVVISNVQGAGGIARAEAHAVPTVVLPHQGFADRVSFDRELVRILREHDVSHVVLAGFMRIVTAELLGAFPMRVINIHPALLPAFPGVDAQDQAFDYGVRVAGCTVHFVDTGKDTGPIIAQAVVPVLPDDTKATLRARILEKEHLLLPTVLQWIAEGRVSVLPVDAASRPRVEVRGARTLFGLP